MTQALNLALLANNINSSGQLNGATGIYGTIPVTNLPTVTVAYGGTGTTATPTNGQIPIGNGSGYALSTLTAGTGMSITNCSGSITLNSSSLPGVLGQVFTSNGTFTIPSGVTAIKVTVLGGGGGGTTLSGCCVPTGNTGGTSSVASGTQTISTISATGGAGGRYANPASPSAGGAGSGGDLNIFGGSGGPGYMTGASIFGGNGAFKGSTVGYGGGGGTSVIGSATSNNNIGAAAGGAAIKYLTGLTPGNTLAVTVGLGGTGASYTGGNGVVIFEW